MKKVTKDKGITLIALVITIIVLLILAGVSIATLTGQNGILTQAQTAKENTELSSEKEGIELAAQSSMTKNPDTLEITKINLDEGIKEQLGNDREFETTDNKDGSFLVNLKNPDRMYYVDSEGEVISEENMLKISTVEELKTFRDNVNSGNSYEGWYVYLTNDIELDINQEWEPIGLYLNENSSPQDETNKPFSGVFDGNGHKVDGIYINTTDKVQGLFGLVNNGKIMNTEIGKDGNIVKVGNASAGLVGYLYNNSKVINCCNKININATNQFMIGGIAGQVYDNCSIKRCYNEGEIIADNNVGGIAGNDDGNSIIKDCYNIGSATGIADTSSSGGIAGDVQNNSKVINCYSIGYITGNDLTGSIVGQLRISTNGKVENCYYLENTVNGANETVIREEITVKTSEELKSMASTLGSAFKEDTNNINNGYPILSWQ